MPIQTFEEMLRNKFLKTYEETQGCVYTLRTLVIEFFMYIMDAEDDDEDLFTADEEAAILMKSHNKTSSSDSFCAEKGTNDEIYSADG